LGNDGFVFAPGAGANVIADAGKAAAIELSAFSSAVIDNVPELRGGETGQPAPFHPASDPGVNLDNHGITTWTNIHLLDVSANHFIIH
jgi:hypothetical protein